VGWTEYYEALASELDAVLLRRTAELQEKIAFHTVPLYFFRGKAERGDQPPSGSGVLLRLQDRHFILTAGHCVRISLGGEIAVGITDRLHTFIPRLDRCAYVENGEGDYGFWEVPPANASTIASKSRVFLSHRSIEILTSRELRNANDWLVLGGYPGILASINREEGPTARLLAYSTVISGVDPAPTSTIEPPPSSENEVDLWVPAAGNIDTVGSRGAVDVPALGGASGGGCWRSGVRPSPERWEPAKMKLVGVHTGSCKPVRSTDGTNHAFAREGLIANHLRLIAREYEDLRPFLYDRWPQLRTTEDP
jgi:hypothetical protein